MPFFGVEVGGGVLKTLPTLHMYESEYLAKVKLSSSCKVKKTFSKRDKLLTCTSTLVMHPLNINVKTLVFWAVHSAV